MLGYPWSARQPMRRTRSTWRAAAAPRSCCWMPSCRPMGASTRWMRSRPPCRARGLSSLTRGQRRRWPARASARGVGLSVAGHGARVYRARARGAHARRSGDIARDDGGPDRARSPRVLEAPGMRLVKSPLTTREREVMDLMSTGASPAQIAKALVVSPETVDSHVRHILRKLDAHSRAEAVEIAEQSRLLPRVSG